MENKYYAGIGARECPKEILECMFKLAGWLGKRGYILRSGAAEGADTAFEQGCDAFNYKKEIYLPWPGFNNSNSKVIVTNEEAFNIAKKNHPFYERLSEGAKKLQARNSHQVLGNDLKTPSKFIVCYTDKGLGKGGTGQAIRVAKAYKIPVFDFGSYKNINEAREKFIEFFNNI